MMHGQQNIKFSIAICRKTRDILRDMWNVSRYFKIFMYSTISSGTPCLCSSGTLVVKRPMQGDEPSAVT
jgi:hypothetical protein